MKLLVVVDMQNDNIDGTLGFPDAKGLDEKILSIIPNYDATIFTLDTHFSNYLDTFEGKVVPTKHCIRGTEGFNIVPSLKESMKSSSLVIEKKTIPSIELADYLKEHPEYDKVDLCGLCSHQAVLANAIMVKSALPEALITVLRSYTTSYDKVLEVKGYSILQALEIEVR